jgi:NAD(P)H-hydrate epimerase
MLSIAVPASLKSILISQLPEALVIGCQETSTGAIAEIEKLDLSQYDAIVCGPGLTLDAHQLIPKILEAESPVILDADGLNAVALLNLVPSLIYRNCPTVLTPHLGEFKRLFSQIDNPQKDRFSSALKAAQLSGSVVLFKGARTVIADPQGKLYCLDKSTPALARGGSGDILAGLIGGLVAQCANKDLGGIVATAAWWHAQGALLAQQERTQLGVDPVTLSSFLTKVLSLLKI